MKTLNTLSLFDNLDGNSESPSSDDESDSEKFPLHSLNYFDTFSNSIQRPNLFQYEHSGVVTFESRARILWFK